jgi:hypothetical protein
MLKALFKFTDESMVVLDYKEFVDLTKWTKNPTLLFVSSEFAETMQNNKPENIKAIFILEKDPKKVDNRERFATGEHLIFQLADELYRCYKNEARLFSESGDLSTAKKKKI